MNRQVMCHKHYITKVTHTTRENTEQNTLKANGPVISYLTCGTIVISALSGYIYYYSVSRV